MMQSPTLGFQMMRLLINEAFRWLVHHGPMVIMEKMRKIFKCSNKSYRAKLEKFTNLSSL